MLTGENAAGQRRVIAHDHSEPTGGAAAAAPSRPHRRGPPRLPVSARPAATPPGDRAPAPPARSPRPARRLETTARAALP